MLDLFKDKSPPWGGYNFSKKSLVAIACGANDNGAVLWAVGGHIRMELEEAGLTSLEDLGITPPSAGVWVWEGRYAWVPGGFECPEDGSMDPVGTHRAPTEEEWSCIRKGQCPWDDSEWLLPEYKEEIMKEREDHGQT